MRARRLNFSRNYSWLFRIATGYIGFVFNFPLNREILTVSSGSAGDRNPVRILSIQSHVAYGHVGNSAAVFALQRLGHEVWPVHTVNYATHTGYGAPTGTVTPAAAIRATIERLDREGMLARCDAVLSGYIGNAETGRAVLDAADMVRARNPDAIWCCDPVMGDLGRGLFVDRAVAALFERHAVEADILMPNSFELTALTGIDAATTATIGPACRELLEGGVRLVVATGLRAGNDGKDGRIAAAAASTETGCAVHVPEIALGGRPNGAGDLFAAVFLGIYLYSGAADIALSHAAGTVYGVLKATARTGAAELRLVDAQSEIADPVLNPVAEKLW